MKKSALVLCERNEWGVVKNIYIHKHEHTYTSSDYK